jgi:hypothetical protein
LDRDNGAREKLANQEAEGRKALGTRRKKEKEEESESRRAAMGSRLMVMVMG